MTAVVAPPFPSNPTVGQIYGGWVWNGTTWVPAPPTPGMTVNTVIFNVSGTYMPSAGLTTCVVECLGGGGQGGGVWNLATGQNAAGGGGASGGYAKKTLPAALVLGGVVVTVGAGGTGAAGNSEFGVSGGTTSFGALCIAYGGGGGGTINTGSGGTGGYIGGPGVGDFATGGDHGQPGWTNLTLTTGEYVAAPPGGAIFGGNHTQDPVSMGAVSPGFAADPNSGAGGSGAVVTVVGQSALGGPGGSGVCIVTEYVWAVSGGPPGCAPVPFVGWDGSCC